MRLVNLTPFSAGVTIAVDKHGQEHILVVNKGTFVVDADGVCSISHEQVPLTYTDKCFGEPGLSSVCYEPDFALHKPAADVLVNGSAYATAGRPTDYVDVTLAVSNIRKTVRVFGERRWQYFPYLEPSRPEPFHSIRLQYERAFGGPSHPWNPVGVGFHPNTGVEIDGMPMPNLEDPTAPIIRPTDKVKPVGFSAIGRNWQPRASWAGTYDDSWLEQHYPFLPPDFDDRFFMSAPSDQICDHFRGGEFVTLLNATPEGRFEFKLPSLDMQMTLVCRGGTSTLTPALDTLLIEPDLRKCVLTWRGSTPLIGKPTEVAQIWVGAASPGRKRAIATGKLYVEKSRTMMGEKMKWPKC